MNPNAAVIRPVFGQAQRTHGTVMFKVIFVTPNAVDAGLIFTRRITNQKSETASTPNEDVFSNPIDTPLTARDHEGRNNTMGVRPWSQRGAQCLLMVSPAVAG